jgi:hypothetical protein
MSNNIGIVDKSISFNGVQSNLNGLRITDYWWNFGDGFIPGGPLMNRSFKKRGEYTVQLGLLAEEDSMGVVPKTCVMKKIRIYEDYQEWISEEEEEKLDEKPDSVIIQSKSMQIRFCFMDDLSERQKTKIKGSLESAKKVVKFNHYGILPVSYPFLNIIGDILKENSDIRLEIGIYAIENSLNEGTMKTAEKWARELAFYFKNEEIDQNSVHNNAFDLSDPLLKISAPEFITADGVLEFIFMKN